MNHLKFYALDDTAVIGCMILQPSYQLTLYPAVHSILLRYLYELQLCLAAILVLLLLLYGLQYLY